MPTEPERDPESESDFSLNTSLNEERQRGENAGRAEALVERLFAEDESARQQSSNLEQKTLVINEAGSPSEPPVFQADVEFDISRFNSQAELYSSFGDDFPCLSFNQDTPVPIDIFPNLGLAPWFGFPPFYPYDYYRFWMREYLYHLRRGDILKESFSERSKVEYIAAPPSEAKGFFRNRLTQFLTTRFIGASFVGASDSVAPPPPGTTTVTSSGLPFCVITSTQGLRVHYSPAYFINPNLVFGSKTSPVCENIKPGRYIFGVAGPGIQSVKFSPAEFDVPHSTQADLLDL